MEVSRGKSSLNRFEWRIFPGNLLPEGNLLQNDVLGDIGKHCAVPIARIQDIAGSQNITVDAQATNIFIVYVYIYI